MASKILQGIGVAALLALVGGSFAALAVVRQRIQVTVADAETSGQRGPDPLEQLRADVADLKTDLGALTEGVGTQMQALHDALDGAAAERDGAARGEFEELKRRLTALQTRSESDANKVAALGRQLDDVAARIVTEIDQRTRGLAMAVDLNQSIAETLATPPVEPATQPSVPSTAIEIPVVAEVEPPAVETPAKTPEPKKGFLSFKIPSQSFAFDSLQRLSIVANLSRVGFDAKSTLHDFSGVTQKIEGELVVNLAKPAAACSGSIQVDATSLDTGLADRDESMRKELDTAAHTSMRFEWVSFELDKLDSGAQKLNGTARGRMTIKGTTRDIAMPVNISVDASKRVGIDGELKVKMSDFGVKPPSQLGLISVEDEIKIWIALRARSLGQVAAETKKSE